MYRNLSSGSSPSEITKSKNKKRRVAKKTFSEALSKSLFEVVIINDSSSSSKVTDDEMHQFIHVLWQFIDSDFVESGLPQPMFDKFGFYLGHLAITCADSIAKDWLFHTVPKLRIWNDAAIRVIDKTDLPKLIKVSVWIPGIPEVPDKVAKRLACYNPDLRVSNWRLFKHIEKSSPSGLVLIFGILEDIIDIIKTRDMTLRYGLDRIPVSISKTSELVQESDPKTDSCNDIEMDSEQASSLKN